MFSCRNVKFERVGLWSRFPVAILRLRSMHNEKRQNQVRNLPLESSNFKVGNQQAFFLLRAAARPTRPVPKSSIVAGSGTGAVGVS